MEHASARVTAMNLALDYNRNTLNGIESVEKLVQDASVIAEFILNNEVPEDK